MGKQKNKSQTNETQNFPVKLKIRIGNKAIVPKKINVQNEELEIEENDDFEVNLEEEIIENEENVVADDITAGYCNEEEYYDDDEDVDKSEDDADNDSDNEEIDTSQANSECVNDNDDEEDEGDDDNDDDDDNEEDDDGENDEDNDDDNETANECSQNDDEDEEDDDDDDDDDKEMSNVDDEYSDNNSKINKLKINNNKIEQKTKPPANFNLTKTNYKNNNNNNINSNNNNSTNSLNDEDEYDDDDWLNDDEDVDYKKYKSACGLTVRQRALFHGEKVEDLMELSTAQRVVELSEEQMQKRRRKAMRRRQLAEEKDEKDKRSTLDKLLKKQDSKLKCQKTDATSKATSNHPSTPTSHLPKPPPTFLRITHNRTGTTISLPTGWQFPLAKSASAPPKATIKCGIEGCSNNKRYNCSKTNLPLCSLQCYKKNLLTISSS